MHTDLFEDTKETQDSLQASLKEQLSPSEVIKRFSKPPEDLLDRLNSVVYLANHQTDQTCKKLLGDLLIPLIEEHPKCRVHSLLAWQDSGEIYIRLQETWAAVEKKTPDHPAVLFNYGKFCSLADPDLAEKLWLRAERCVDLVEDSALALSELYFFRSLTSNDPHILSVASDFLILAIDRHNKNPTSQYLDIYQEMLLERTAAQSIKCNSGSIAKRCAKIIYSLPLVKEEMIDSDGGSVELIRHKYAKHKADSFLGLAQLIDSEEDLAVETFQRMSQQAVPIDIDLRFSERMLPIDKDLVLNFLHGCKQQFSTRLEDYQMLKNLEPKENGYVVWAKRQNLSTESITQYISKPIVEKIRSLDNLINSVN